MTHMHLKKKNEETIVTVFDFFQSFIEYDIPMIAPFVKQLTDMTLEFIVDPGLKKQTKICAINFLNVLIETQKAVCFSLFLFPHITILISLI